MSAQSTSARIAENVAGLRLRGRLPRLRLILNYKKILCHPAGQKLRMDLSKPSLVVVLFCILQASSSSHVPEVLVYDIHDVLAPWHSSRAYLVYLHRVLLCLRGPHRTAACQRAGMWKSKART